jgi:nitrogen-specific signal transduction histidine kinase/CheY-like chemotaxis protein
VLGVVLVFRDISEARATERERRTMEERLQQAAKLESLGVLAGGIAHDFNNLLVGILGNASLSLETLPEDSEVRPMLDQVVTAAQRAADLTRQMLAYAGKGKFYVEKVRMGELVRDTLPLIQSSIPRSVRLEVEIHDDCLVEADATQLQQIIMNLVINAGEACSGRSGLVRVATSDLQIDQGAMPGVFGATSIEPGAYVCLEVRDNGTGMDQETLGKIFDPFFTTKFTGRGLGLAATLGIVRGHGGVLQVESKPGEGSRFRVLLPATGLPGRRPVVVVADGEARVREMAKMVLEHAGYEVVAVDSSAQAAAMATDYSGRVVAAVLVEARAEGLTEAVAEVRRLLPKAPVIVVSGMPEAQIRTMLDGVRVDGFLEKPYTAGLLSEKVKAVAGGELS